MSALEPGAFPELHELEGGGLFTLRVDEVRAPELQPFEAVREQVESDWVLAETRRRLLEQARQIADQIGPDTEFTELGLDGAISETGLTRRSFLNGTPPGFMGQVFDLDVGGTAVVEGSASVLIVRLMPSPRPPKRMRLSLPKPRLWPHAPGKVWLWTSFLPSAAPCRLAPMSISARRR